MLKNNNDMQTSVNDFIEKYQLQSDIKTRYIDLMSELGEFGKEILINTNYGKRELEVNEQMADEIGDCLFSMLALCCEMGVDSRDMLAGTLEKYEGRFLRKGDLGSDNG